MVDQERLARIVARILRDLAELRDTAGGPPLGEDGVRLRAVKYGFITTIEGCVRAAQHVVSSEGLAVPETNAEAVRALGRAGMIDSELANRVARAVGFRNVLVHEYAEVDDQRVVANLELLDDIEQFARAVAALALPPGK